MVKERKKERKKKRKKGIRLQKIKKEKTKW